jgi:hypothetical protein
MRYKVFDPESKVIGQAMLGFKAAADQEAILPLLEKYGLTDIQPDQWYPMQKWLDVLSDISEQMDEYSSMLSFVNVGEKVAANVSMPDQLINEMGFIEFMYQFGSSAYFRYHQGNVGTNQMEKMSDTHLKFILATPYPPDFWYGIFYGSAKRYINHKTFVVQYEELAMRHFHEGQIVIIHLRMK